MKVVVCEFNQESNSFNPEITKREMFEYYGIYIGEEMYTKTKNKPRAIAAMFDVLYENGIEIIPACSMYSQSGGRIEHSVLEWFINKVSSVLSENMPIDGVFISLHGATQTTECDDVCGYILEKIRTQVGNKAVISASADMHANITKKIMENTDFICGFHTYPHTDYYETGYRAAKLGVEKLKGNRKYAAVRVGIPMIIPANGYTTLDDPFKSLMDYAESKVNKGKLADCSIFMMQPWLDVEEGATTVVTVATEKSEAEKHAMELAEKLFSLRNSLQPDLFSIDQVIDLAEKSNTNKPIVLVDCADSSNAGATGDGVAVVERLIKRESCVKTATMLTDARAVDYAFSLGVGKKGEFTLGGTKDPVHNKSIKLQAYVKSLHDGVFIQEGPAGKGMKINIGKTAVLNIGNIDMIVCYNLSGNGDPQLYKSVGIDPKNYKLVVVKACTSFRASYRKFAEKICLTDTPGAASSNLLSLDFKKLPKTFYPFSNLDDYQIDDIIYGRE